MREDEFDALAARKIESSKVMFRKKEDGSSVDKNQRARLVMRKE